MSYRTDFLTEHGWTQVSPRKWCGPVFSGPVEIMKAERLQKQILAGACHIVCPCGWPLAEVLKETVSGQAYVQCYDCREKRLVGIS
jgi:hypothetical protein